MGSSFFPPSRPRPWFSANHDLILCANNNKKVNIYIYIYIYIFQKPEHSKKYVFLSKCIEKNQKNTVNKVEENEPEKLNNLLITDYAKVKNKEQKRWQPHASQNSYTFQALK